MSISSERCALVVAGLLGAGQAWAAGSVEVRVSDGGGAAVEYAVITLHAKTSLPEGEAQVPRSMVDQIDETFVPHVRAIEAGTLVDFPNSDDIRHHVYSFSEPMSFELPLYKGMPAEPVLFDRPGVVVLGCNIHDHMRAYVYVADTPHFLVSGADGSARLDTLPAGSYRVGIWHPRQDGEAPPRTLDLADGEAASISFELTLRSGVRIQRRPAERRRRY